MAKLTNDEREKFYVELCALMGEKSPIARMWFCDLAIEMFMGIKYSIHPIHLEKWLNKRGIYANDGESIYDLMNRKFGKRAVELVDILI